MNSKPSTSGVALSNYRRSNHPLKSFTIRDKKADCYILPYFSVNIATACRDMQSRLTNQPQLVQFAADYALYSNGGWDPSNGLYDKPLPEPIFICEILELIPEKENT